MATTSDVRDQFGQKAEHINARRDLTQYAKEVLTAREFVKTRDSLAEAKQRHYDELKAERTRHERKLFGSVRASDSAAAVSRRDAEDRAEAVTDSVHALSVLRRAERNGDEHLAQAVAARAVDYRLDEGWASVLDEYVSTRPGAREALDRLRELPDPNDVAYQFTVEMQFAVVASGPLAGKRPDQLDRLAAVDLDAA